jgi:ATP-binding protein involved in chromosome partitioning
MFGLSRRSPKRESVIVALDAIRLPDGRGLIASGAAQGLAIEPDGRVRFIIEIAPEAASTGAALRQAAESAVAAVRGVTGVSVVLTAHSQAPAAAPPPARPSAPQGEAIGEVRRVRKGARLSDEAASQTTPRAGAAQIALPGIRAVIAVASAKGGVGKSTVAVNLAVALSRLGKRVGLLDADIYGPSVPTMLGLAEAEPATGPDRKLIPLDAFGVNSMSIGYLVDPDAPMIWRGPIVMSALTQMLNDVAWGALDILVVDMPPGTGDAQLTMAQRVPLSGVVIVSTPQEIALIDVRRGVAMFQKTAVPILGIVENMAYFQGPDGARVHLFGEGGARRTAEALGAPFLGELPIDIALREGGDAGAPLVASDPQSETAGRFLAIAAQVAEALDAGVGLKPPPEILIVD